MRRLPLVLGLLGFTALALEAFAAESPQATETVELRAVLTDDAGDPLDAFTLTVYRETGDVRTMEYLDAKGRLVADIDRRASVLALSAPGRETHVQSVEFHSPGSLDLGNVRLSRAVTVRGRVVDAETGHPLAGARVDHFSWSDGISLAMKGVDWRPAGLFDITGAEGTFALHGLRAGGSQALALAEGYRGRVFALEEDQGDITVQLYPLAEIEGTLTTEAGSPAPGTVWLSRDGGNTQWHLAAATGGLVFHPIKQRIGSDGRFRFEGLQSGAYKLSANSPQGAVKERRVTIGEEDPSQRVTMIVEHAGEISGTVSGLMEGETVTVSVVPEEQARGDLFVSDVGNGAYTLAGVQDGPARVRATTKSRTGFRTLWADVDVSAGQAWVDFDFGYRSSLWGVVRAGSDRLASVRVTARPKDAKHPRSVGFTDAEGRYELAGLATGEYEVRAEWTAKQAMQVLNVSVLGQTLTDIGFPTASIAGTVQTDMAGLSAGRWRANIHAVFENGRSRAIWTDSAGGYRFEQLEEGRYTIMAAPVWTGDFPTVTVADGGALEGVDLQLTLADTREMRFLDALTGEQFERVDVEVEGGPFHGTHVHIPLGKHVPLTLTGHELAISKEGYEPVTIQWDGHAGSVSLAPIRPEDGTRSGEADQID